MILFLSKLIINILAWLNSLAILTMPFVLQHDPISSFTKETCLLPVATPTTLPYNVDKKFVYIAPSLCVAGFGGSLPAFLRNGDKFWNSKYSSDVR